MIALLIINILISVIHGCVSFNDKIKAIFYSHIGLPFKIIIYDDSGIQRIYKGRKITYEGKLSCYAIFNDSNNVNHISISFYAKNTDIFGLSWIEFLSYILPIISIIFLKSEHKITQISLLTLLFIKLYGTEDYSKAASENSSRIPLLIATLFNCLNE